MSSSSTTTILLNNDYSSSSSSSHINNNNNNNNNNSNIYKYDSNINNMYNKYRIPHMDDSILQATSSSSSCSPLASPQLIKSNSYSGTSSTQFPLESNSESTCCKANAATQIDDVVTSNEESGECDAFLINSRRSSNRTATTSTSAFTSTTTTNTFYLRRNSCWHRLHGFVMSNWYLSYLVPISLVALVLLVGYLTRNYAKALLFWIETQNSWLIFVIFLALFTLVSFPIVVGYLVLLITAGYLFGFWRGWLTVILGANMGIAIAHATIRACRHRISVHK